MVSFSGQHQGRHARPLFRPSPHSASWLDAITLLHS